MTAAIAAGEFVLPNLGESIGQATVTRWLKNVGNPRAGGSRSSARSAESEPTA